MSENILKDQNNGLNYWSMTRTVLKPEINKSPRNAKIPEDLKDAVSRTSDGIKATVNERINRLIFELGLNKMDFAISIGKAPTVISQMIQGRNKPGFEVLESILKTYPQVSSDWLMKGEGEMLREGNYTIQFAPKDGGKFGEQVAEDMKKEISWLRDNLDRALRIIEKADLGKNEVYPLQTAIAA